MLDEAGVVAAPGVADVEPGGVVVADAVDPGVPAAGVPAPGVPGPGVAAAVVVVVVVDVPVGESPATWFVTVAWQRTSAPPPFPEPLHWSMWMGNELLVVDDAATVQTNATLVPPLPEPLHWPTVAAPTEEMPGVLAGLQLPGAPLPVISEPMHW